MLSNYRVGRLSLSGLIEMTSQKVEILLRQSDESNSTGFCEIRRDTVLQDQLMSVVDDASDQSVLEWVNRKKTDRNTVFLSVVNRLNGEFLGYVQITDIHWRNKSGHTGIAILKSKQGLGIGKKAIVALHDYAKKEVKLFKLLLNVRSDNLRAMLLYESLGYRKVGILEKHFPTQSGRCDVFVYEKIL